MTQYMRTASSIAIAAAAGLLATSAMAADLGGNCCADLEERVSELEATTARKGNRKVSLQIYGQVSEAVMWWNDGSESNIYVQENNWIKNTVGFQGNAKITSDWSAGFRLELQVRAYRSSNANQLALGASNNTQIAVYNTQSVSLRHAFWYLQSAQFGRITVGRDVDSSVGTSTISLVNPDGFSGANGPGFAQGGFFLRRAGTTGNQGLSARTWQSAAWINNGDGPLPMDYAQTKGLVKYTSPFFLGHTKSSGFQFSADWGADDAWAVGLRYAEEFGGVRLAAGIGYSDFSSPDRGFCSSSNNLGPETAVPAGAATTQGDISCNSLQMSGSLLHVATGLFLSGGYAQLNNKEARNAMLSSTIASRVDQAVGLSGKSDFWWIMGGWQAKLNPLGSTIFWGQYVDVNVGLSVNNNAISLIAANDQLVAGTTFAGGAILRSSSTQAWGLGVTQNIDAAAMALYLGFHNVSTDLNIGSTTTAARGKTNAVDDFQVFYTGATIRF